MMTALVSLPPLAERTLEAVVRGRLSAAPDTVIVRDPSRAPSCAQLYEEALV